ncbi:MAG: DNA-binding protein [Thermoplasmata archaeon]|nr:MAG: DNA-binding protein [Thermoplasmata archaeon]
MVVWIGIDDTDSKKGGCTTYVAYRLIDRLLDEGYSLIGFPRLVRLNPNIPWKTRGNGAVSFRIGRGKGKSITVGERDGREFPSFGYADNDVDLEHVKEIIEEILEEEAHLSDEATNPGYVITKEKPERELYERCVKSVVSLEDVLRVLRRIGAVYRGYKNGRGIIGATSAISWEPLDRTFEVITYRRKEMWGRKREVDERSVIEMDRSIRSTFDNYDYETKRILITPNSPCPVLFGIRGDDPFDLLRAKDMISSEDYAGWLLFETNQATDDHLERKKISDIKPYESVIVKGLVDRDPFVIEGGHVIFRIRDDTSSIDCTAYEPTKSFRNIVRKLRRGDVVEVYGGVRSEPFTINIEKIRIERLARLVVKVENPVCERCKIHMKSIGKGKGYRGRRCGAVKGEEDARYEELERGIRIGFYEVPPSARRHLSKPLKRLNVPP